eukprot:TRINITY_DN2957_c0_g1_i6.p2 TRINITY_DN2957_c0_g1~~TRINITY_DN2957_c0_g1_i6.p2  ORF type:complete len:299 (+),score=67.50 TRINITY_DN2957_c0_g1_i6:97-897(+)
MRGHGEILMGKNTMMRKAIRELAEEREDLEQLLPYIVNNIGFVFTNENLKDVRDIITKFQVEAPAKAGAIAPVDVKINAGPTTLGPEKTSFFQALNIPTKINRGTIEILSDIHLIHEDCKVGASEAALLTMLNIMPFEYGLILTGVYDNGSMYDPEVLDLTDDVLMARFLEGARRVAAISLAIGYPTLASIPHSLVNGFKKVLAVAVATEIEFPQAEKIKAYLKDPSAFAAAAPAAAAGGAAPAAAAAAPEPEEESEEEEGFSLFD